MESLDLNSRCLGQWGSKSSLSRTMGIQILAVSYNGDPNLRCLSPWGSESSLSRTIGIQIGVGPDSGDLIPFGSKTVGIEIIAVQDSGDSNACCPSQQEVRQHNCLCPVTQLKKHLNILKTLAILVWALKMAYSVLNTMVCIPSAYPHHPPLWPADRCILGQFSISPLC